MTDGRFEVRRPDLVAGLLARTRHGGAFLLTGPPGAGKTTLLQRLAEALAREGWVSVYLDLMGAASCPDRFVAAALDVLPAEAFGGRLAEATEIRRLASAGRAEGAAAVKALFSLWSGLERAGSRPVALLVDEATEIRSLAYFQGLREVDRAFAAAVAARRRGTVLATSFPTLARSLWPGLETVETPPLTTADLQLLPGLGPAAAAAVARASFGWPRHARILAERVAAGGDLVRAWAEEMAPGGRLELGCRHTYETLLLRSRGYGIAKAALAAVAREEGLNLTALVARLGRTPGATRDYLQWLVRVDALRVVKKRYYYVDGLVRWWVRIHARGVAPSPAELEAAARQAVNGGLVEPASGEPALPEPVELPASEAAPRRDSLMEID